MLLFKTDFDGLNYQLRFNPAELKLMAAILRKEVTKEKKDLQNWYKQNDAYDEFSFKISSGEKDLLIQYSDDKEMYNQKLFYLIESAQFDFSIVRKLDTISPTHYQFENNYGNAPFISIYLAFEKAQKDNPVKEFIFNDQVFGNRIIPIDIQKLNTLNIPKIK
ncbi:hypothetical protein [Fluviicola sp.]|uniref:hypothetical protein n=1 Tax=Fluviicola sp. TaxID=1917219 RepID=UPI0026134852|nr:hypothetical protein [Fluviicola sp.]